MKMIVHGKHIILGMLHCFHIHYKQQVVCTCYVHKICYGGTVSSRFSAFKVHAIHEVGVPVARAVVTRSAVHGLLAARKAITSLLGERAQMSNSMTTLNLPSAGTRETTVNTKWKQFTQCCMSTQSQQCKKTKVTLCIVNWSKGRASVSCCRRSS